MNDSDLTMLIVALAAIAVGLILHGGLSTRAPRLADIARIIKEESLKFEKFRRDFSPYTVQYTNSRLSIIYTRLQQDGNVNEVLDMRCKGYGGGYRIWFTNEDITRFEKSMTSIPVDDQSRYFSAIILTRLQQAEALRG